MCDKHFLKLVFTYIQYRTYLADIVYTKLQKIESKENKDWRRGNKGKRMAYC